MWYLFLDDIRSVSFLDQKKEEKNLKYVEGPWIVARSMQEALDLIESKGMPQVISFDHDLGDKVPTGFDFSKWIVEKDLDDNILPKDFDYQVHSDNPVGRDNIVGLLNQYLSFKKK